MTGIVPSFLKASQYCDCSWISEHYYLHSVELSMADSRDLAVSTKEHFFSSSVILCWFLQFTFNKIQVSVI